MGTFKKGILGGFSGTVGTVVGANWRGLDVMRSRPKSSNANPTAAQMLQREKFALAIKFQNALRKMQSRLYGDNAGVQSRVNLAAKHLLTEVVTEEGGKAVLQMSKVLVTKGDLTGFEGLTVTPNASGVLEFSWNDNSNAQLGKKSDIFSTAVYEDESGEFAIHEGPETREEASATVQLPASWVGKNVHVYAFFQNAEQTKACTSQYVGSVAVL